METTYVPLRGAGHNMFIDGKGISFRYDDSSTNVLARFDFSIETQSVVAILGPSGCGKSTLLKLITGLLQPTTGTLYVDGKSPRAFATERSTGYMFQSPLLLPWLDALNNVALPLTLGEQPVPQITEARRVAARLLERLGLAGSESARPFQLSGGMMQRVSLARSLVTNPSLLLLDEPFGSLDPLLRLKLACDISRTVRAERTTVLLVSHNMEESLLVADRLLILGGHPARIVADIDNRDIRHGEIKTLENFVATSRITQIREILMKDST